jgi:hypothetical protein
MMGEPNRRSSMTAKSHTMNGIGHFDIAGPILRR